MEIPRDKIGEMGAESEYKPLSVEKVRQLAMDLIAGQVFASWQIAERDQHLLGTIFMPLLFVDELTQKQWQRDGINHLYGHMRDSVMRSINGYPIFHSFGVLDNNDANRVFNMAKKMSSIMTEMEEDENG